MNKLIVAFAMCLSVSVPSFGAEHVLTHSAKVAGSDSYKAAKDSAKATVVKDSAKGTGKVLKSLF